MRWSRILCEEGLEMRATLLKSIAVSVALLVLATWVRAQSDSDRPPGVDEETWIALSDDAGIVITNVTFAPSEGLQRTGVLMAKFNGAWMRVDLAPPGARVQHLR
jgi:hypothetical protein